ncbi:MAG: hypothetical protein IKF90_24585 [Parasporobacterium sp.]|nr:hypothetical protein [Parasporobacterium sp.]
MISPTKVINLLKEKNGMASRHPRFVSFVGQSLRGIKENEQLVIAVIHEDGSVDKCKMHVAQEDETLLRDIGGIFK